MTATQNRSEGGYVLAQTALLLIPLMIFAAFATDIGSWYVQSQKLQRAADAAALAGVTQLPDLDKAITEARAVATRNGLVDQTPTDNTDFDTGPLPQLEVTSPKAGVLEVAVKRREPSFLGRLVLDSIVVERFAIAEFTNDVYLGNPTSGLGTGTISPADLGMPNDQTWLALNAYCWDKQRGDLFASGFYSGPFAGGTRTCGPTPGQIATAPQAHPNPNYDPDAYVFVVESQPSSAPLDISIFEPGAGCPEVNSTNDASSSPRLHYRLYGPNLRTNHRQFVDTNSPIREGLLPTDACVANSPTGDGWWPVGQNLTVPGSDGGYYYLQLGTRNPDINDLDPADPFWEEIGINFFSLKTTRSGTSQLCAFTAADPTCPQLYALEWLPLWRELPSSEADFFLAEVPEGHRGSTMVVTLFDAADGVDNIQIADPSGRAVPFEWRYVDRSLGQMSGNGYFETDYAAHTATCNWAGSPGNPCLETRVYSNFNDHLVQISIDIPPDYTCGGDCWWKARYTTALAPGDRTVWAIAMTGDPVRLVE